MIVRLNLSVEYHTVWGESVVFCQEELRTGLTWCGNGLWYGSIGGFDTEKEYTYIIERDGECVRKEWKRHHLPQFSAGCGTVCLRDRWNEIQPDQPFYSSLFTKSVFRRFKPASVPVERLRQGSILICTAAAGIRPGQVLAICGSADELGNWARPVAMYDGDFPVWKAVFPAIDGAEYKYVIADAESLEIIEWEQGDNRVFRRGLLSREWNDGVSASGKAPSCGSLQGFSDALYVFNDRPPVFCSCLWRGAGTAVPVFSLRSGKSFGIGEFSDLKLLADWAVKTGQSILQLLPVNDTTMAGNWMDSYPYNANSTYALHPQFINLEAAGLKASPEYNVLREELNSLPQVDYERVNKVKIAYLRSLYAEKKKNVAESEEYFLFFKKNRHWLVPYAVFCCLRDEYGTADFSRWEGWAEPSLEKISSFAGSRPDDVGFWYFVQYHLHLQLSEACSYARDRGVVLKGDLPIGVSRTSVDAWLHPSLFNMDSCAGAPPDDFAADGQNWGFPTYNWDVMSRDGFSWWKSRLAKMSEYFDAFRIDHILGFFRIWEIPLGVRSGLLGHFSPALPYSAGELEEMGFDTGAGYVLCARQEARESCSGALPSSVESMDFLFIEDRKKPGYFHPRIAAQNTAAYASLPDSIKSTFDRLYEDFFYHRHNAFWKASAMGKLPALLSSTGMLACGEDLGMIPASVPEVMSELKILSLEIQRMPKAFGETFADPASYPYLSVCTTSTHDMNPLRAWWDEDRALTSRFWNEVLGEPGEAPEDCSPWICREIVQRHLDSPAMLAILPLQDWMSTDGKLRYGGDPAAERINDPAESRHYWRYRMHLTLEELLASDDFNGRLREMIIRSGRR